MQLSADMSMNKAIVFTVDAPRLGTRERDERNKFKMPDHRKFDNHF